MYMHLGRLLLKNKLFLNIIVIFQLSVALLIFNVLIGCYNKAYSAYRFTENYL